MKLTKLKDHGLCGFWLFAFFYWEILTHAAMNDQFQSSFFFALGFAAVIALIFTALTGLLPQKALFPVSLAAALAVMFVYGSQMVYCFIFGTPYSISQMGLGTNAVTHFWRETLSSMLEHIFWILGMLVPIAALAAAHRFDCLKKAQPIRCGAAAAAAVSLLLITVAGIRMGGSGMYSTYYFFTNSSSTTTQTMERFGVPVTFVLEMMRPESETLLLEEDFFIPEVPTEAAATQPAIQEPVQTDGSDEAPAASEEAPTEPEEQPVTYNIMDADLAALAKKEQGTKLGSLHSYFSKLTGTPKNEYTGMFRDYNLIEICAESFSSAAIDPKVTPTLYKLAHEGFVFNNYYNSFPNTTTNGEYALMQGLFPDAARDKYNSSMLASQNNRLPFTLGNAFKEQLHVTSWGYHNYTGDYYNRRGTHPNMGYKMQFNHDGMELTPTWPASDLEMMEQSIDDYINQPQFHAYYMTFSGHYQYKPDVNAIVKKNYSAVSDIPGYNTLQKSYLSCHIELDKALEYLLQRLEEAGIAEKTVIVLTSDHYPYGIPEDDYFAMLGQKKDKLAQYKSPLIFWVGGMEEPVEVNEYCCNVDILPTLLNLWGLEYDSRMLSGTDVFSDSLHVAVLFDHSFLTDIAWFNSNNGKVIYQVDESQVPEGYVDSMNKLISNRFEIAKEIVRYDYYSLLFPKK